MERVLTLPKIYLYVYRYLLRLIINNKIYKYLPLVNMYKTVNEITKFLDINIT